MDLELRLRSSHSIITSLLPQPTSDKNNLVNVFCDRVICDMSTLEDFKNYVTESGVNFDGLSDDKKGEWRERFDKSKGKFFLGLYVIC